ncbi:MAG: DEAD/DEAH box helicase [Selenomonadaceae bacterium]|nr:DEAD/DEAH box helicase [Selenomonadaceae bacterium]
MVTVDELLEKYRSAEISERDKGAKFERLMKNFLLTNPVYRGKFSDVWLWNEFPFRDELGTVDLGIDIVCKEFDGNFWAVQCKFYAETSVIDKAAVDTFLATSSKTFDGDKKFSARLWISTSDNLTDNAEITLQNQSPPVARIGMEELRKVAVDWEKLDAGSFGKEAVKNFREPLPHQLDAINAAQNHFQNHNRGKLIMACGTGKTYTSLKIAETLAPNGKILFLVPSIALLSQTLYEWATFAEKPFNYICVCSDETVSKKTEDEIKGVNLPLPATTNPDEISRRLETFSDNMTVVFSTYQSLDKVSAAKISFDLIICDEAHRTTGYGKDSTPFTAVHDKNFVHGKKRLYMTATPKLYKADAKKTAVEKDLLLWSMDDEEIFGEEFFYFGFSEAIRIGKLADYKVIVLTVSEKNIPAALQNAINDKNNAIKTDDALKLIGCINALSKRVDVKSKPFIEDDQSLMHTAVAFCPKIKYSEYITEIFSEVQRRYCADMPAEVLNSFVEIQSAHIDGTMPADKREDKLSWLKTTPVDGNICRVLSNVRCLSEGVDVPTLDAVLFLSSKKSKVEIVQAVGRALRTARDKKYGYIIIPVVIPANKSPELVLDSSDFKTVWDVLNALRAHDERIDAEIQRIAVKKDSDKILVDKPPPIAGDDDSEESPQLILSELLNWHELRDKIYARMVEHVGNRLYWVQWAQKVAVIVERHTKRITELISVEGEPRRAFYNFLHDLQKNLNPNVTPKEAIDMLAQHLVTRPVFEALFENYSFAEKNPVSRAMQEILDKLDEDGMSKDREIFARLYENVRENCRDMGDAANRQRIVNHLYENFFRIAFKKTAEKLGIVYSPVEVADFILRSVDAVLKAKFNRTLADKDIHIIEPFVGTGTFIVRLIQLGLIPARDLIRKYKNKEIWANEIMLLAYYIAAVNIENAFHDAAKLDEYIPFPGICLTDTFQAYEDDKQQTLEIFGSLKKNSERVEEQKKSPIKIIVCNPPYSVGQRSANDNAQNIFYPKLECRIAATYAAKTAATLKGKIYDSYVKAFRWASDRIGDEGVIGFVTNAGWLDNNSMDGLRKCFAEEFAEIYVFNLRGDQRTQGISKIEGGKIFGSGSRAPIAVTILVKAPHDGDAKIFYRDIGDYLSRDEKLSKLNEIHDVLQGNFQPITPNERGDWINQRGDEFDNFIPLAPDKKFDGAAQSFFVTYSLGLNTNRDVFAYNFSKTELEKNIRTTIDYYNTHEPTEIDSTKFVWSDLSKSNKNRGRKYIFNAAQIVESLYRPFCKQNLYYDEYLNDRRGQMPKFFPTGREENLLICVTLADEGKFSPFITNKVTNLHFNGDTQCFPLYYYERAAQGSLFGDNYERRDGVSDFIWSRAKLLYGIDVTREDIFYYVYGFLHLPSYREKFSAELKKSLPRIILTPDAKKFWQLSRAGRNLAKIHLNYESQPPPEGVEVIGAEKNNFAVKKLRFASKDDRTTLIYNEHITIENIPSRSFEYVINGRSPLEWIIDRYQVKTDSASGIVNNPNDWASEHDNPRYILDLILSSITVSLKTLDIVDSLPIMNFD